MPELTFFATTSYSPGPTSTVIKLGGGGSQLTVSWMLNSPEIVNSWTELGEKAVNGKAAQKEGPYARSLGVDTGTQSITNWGGGKVSHLWCLICSLLGHLNSSGYCRLRTCMLWMAYVWRWSLFTARRTDITCLWRVPTGYYFPILCKWEVAESNYQSS